MFENCQFKYYLSINRNIIDVAAMDSHNLEPQELNDRIRLYSHKLSQQWGTLQEDSISASNGKFKFQNIEYTISFFNESHLNQFLNLSAITGLLKDIPSSEAERLLSAVPITESDLHLVSNYIFEILIFKRFSISIDFRINFYR